MLLVAAPVLLNCIDHLSPHMDHGDGDGDPCSDPLTPPEDCRSLGAGGHEVGDSGVRALAEVSSSEPDSY